MRIPEHGNLVNTMATPIRHYNIGEIQFGGLRQILGHANSTVYRYMDIHVHTITLDPYYDYIHVIRLE